MFDAGPVRPSVLCSSSGLSRTRTYAERSALSLSLLRRFESSGRAVHLAVLIRVFIKNHTKNSPLFQRIFDGGLRIDRSRRKEGNGSGQTLEARRTKRMKRKRSSDYIRNEGAEETIVEELIRPSFPPFARAISREQLAASLKEGQ